MQKFKAYRIFDHNGRGEGRVVEMGMDELDPGAVVIKIAYSSVNFKDALAGTGAGKIIRRYPCVGGIDLSGMKFENAGELIIDGVVVVANMPAIAHFYFLSVSASTPGSFLPSRNSSEAPPPVEM